MQSPSSKSAARKLNKKGVSRKERTSLATARKEGEQSRQLSERERKGKAGRDAPVVMNRVSCEMRMTPPFHFLMAPMRASIPCERRGRQRRSGIRNE